MKTAIQPTLFDTADFDEPVSPIGKKSLVRHLRAQIGCVTTASPETTETFSTGAACVDRLLPRGGLRVDGITEWTADAAGCGAASLAMIAAATRLSKATGPLVVVGGDGTFYPPAAVALGPAVSACRFGLGDRSIAAVRNGCRSLGARRSPLG